MSHIDNRISPIHANMSRLIRRNKLAMMLWREKIIELVANYRSWKVTMDGVSGINKEYKLIQSRRVKRLVSQAYVEYRRKQSELKILRDIQRRQGHAADAVEAAIESQLSPPALPVGRYKTKRRKFLA